MGGKILKETDGAGLVFGRLTILGWAGKTARNHRLWQCRCSCGKEKEAEMHDLVIGKIKSCGCLKTEVLQEGSIVHGATMVPRASGLGRTFEIWVGMRARCGRVGHKGWANYGGRGITVSPDWDTFPQFLADMGVCPPGCSIEREDVNKGYSKDNCSWLPRRMQAMNKRTTIRIAYQGQEWCMKRLCEYLNLKYLKAWKRYVLRDWPLHQALELPDDGNKPERI